MSDTPRCPWQAPGYNWSADTRTWQEILLDECVDCLTMLNELLEADGLPVATTMLGEPEPKPAGALMLAWIETRGMRQQIAAYDLTHGGGASGKLAIEWGFNLQADSAEALLRLEAQVTPRFLAVLQRYPWTWPVLAEGDIERYYGSGDDDKQKDLQNHRIGVFVHSTHAVVWTLGQTR